MSENKHTPGPWGYWEDSCSECERLGSAEYVIDGPPGGNHGQFSHEPDARLIAAAPELLEALKKAKDVIRVWHGPIAWDIYDRASPEMTEINAAIANAEGRS